MTTEDDKQLRQVLRMMNKLPDPDWNLFARTTKRWSSSRPAMPTIKSMAQSKQNLELQRQKQVEKDEYAKKKIEAKDKVKAEKEKQQIISQSIHQYKREKKAFEKDLNRMNTRLDRLKNPKKIIRQAEIIKTMNENLENMNIIR